MYSEIIQKADFPLEKVNEGSFGRVSDCLCGVWQVYSWYPCREIFHEISQGFRRMCFSHSKDNGPNIAAFIDRFEDKLDVKPRSVFGPLGLELCGFALPLGG